MIELILFIGCSIGVSAITTKILATHYFEIVDGYVKDVVEKAKQTMEEICQDPNKP